MTHRMNQIEPSRFVTQEECQKMIDQAIDKHNKTATIISASLGSILLFFYAHGVISIIDKFK